jgi:cytochrome bd ubiquinol oxidase subunit II
MPILWFAIVAAMLTAYVVLDGFDLGAGVIYLIAAKSSSDRRKILRAIGPVWDGNEVWLIAAGGTLYFAFPLLYASSFSGFYLPLMIVLWLLMLRGIGIELRAHMDNPVWRGFFDLVFSLSSLLLTIFFGAALGNVVRGVPLGPDGYFFEPLWTNFRTSGNTGILDWYTILTGLIALITLTTHGALYIAVKTEGDLNTRARSVAKKIWPLQLLLTFVGLIATGYANPAALNNYKHHAVGFVIPIAVFASLTTMLYANRNFDPASAPDVRKEKLAFTASTIYIIAMLAGVAFALYPAVLPASTNPAYSLTIENTAASPHGLAVGLAWWIPGLLLTTAYFVFIYRMFKGKVQLEGDGY